MAKAVWRLCRARRCDDVSEQRAARWRIMMETAGGFGGHPNGAETKLFHNVSQAGLRVRLKDRQ